MIILLRKKIFIKEKKLMLKHFLKLTCCAVIGFSAFAMEKTEEKPEIDKSAVQRNQLSVFLPIELINHVMQNADNNTLLSFRTSGLLFRGFAEEIFKERSPIKTPWVFLTSADNPHPCPSTISYFIRWRLNYFLEPDGYSNKSSNEIAQKTLFSNSERESFFEYSEFCIKREFEGKELISSLYNLFNNSSNFHFKCDAIHSLFSNYF